MISEKYDFSKDYEEEIKSFKSLLKFEHKEIDPVIRKILLINKFRNNFNENNTHYKNYIIYDLMLIIEAIERGAIRDYYNYYRSSIENFIRIMLKLDNQDETGVNKLFKTFKKMDNNKKHEDIYEFLENEYAEACNFVHSNIKATIKIYEYYSEIKKQRQITEEKEIELLKKLNKTLKYFIEDIFIIYDEEIKNIFFRRKDEINFLLEEI